MKIGIVCPYDITRSGGVQEHVIAQAAELRRRGHTVKILTPRPRRHVDDPAADVIFIGSSTNVKTPIKTSLELGASFKRDAVDDVLAAENFDLLHIHEPEVPVLGSQILAKASCPVVATFHALYPDTPLGRTLGNLRIPFARSIFSRLSAMTAVSDAAAGFVREISGRSVEIIPNGIDLDKYTAKPHALNPKPRLLYIGRLEKRKGVRYLLKAFALLAAKMPQAELLIAGDGHLRPGLEKFVRENKIPNVHFLGFVDEAAKLRLLQQATLFCSPAIYGESFGIVLLEAMASGTVTVAGDNAGYASVLQDTGRLSLVDPRQTEEFCHRLELMLTDEAIRQTWLKWAADYIQQFDYRRVVDKYEQLYSKVRE